jgi:hypothetical protein
MDNSIQYENTERISNMTTPGNRSFNEPQYDS